MIVKIFFRVFLPKRLILLQCELTLQAENNLSSAILKCAEETGQVGDVHYFCLFTSSSCP